jgi:hypothetical protein
VNAEDRAEYERYFLTGFQKRLDSAKPYRSVHHGREQHVVVESVRLDASGPDHEIVVLLRDLTRPECQFGWRATAVAPEHDEFFEPTPRYGLKDAAENHAMIVAVNLEEDLLAIGYGLPKDCSSSGINWF